MARVIQREDYEKYLRIKQFVETELGEIPVPTTPPPAPPRKRAKLGYGENRNNIDVATPKDLYQLLDNEFHFDHDPCPLNGLGAEGVPDGLKSEWGQSNYVNPPFNNIAAWVDKSIEQCKKGKLVVMLIAARIASKYWFDKIWPIANEIRILHKITFEGYKEKSPLPVAIVVFKDLASDREVQTKGAYKWITV
jgi:hypothetical protein